MDIFREIIAAAGGLTLILLAFGKKMLELAYDGIKARLLSDIEKDKLKFEHDLNERLKCVEESIARASHAAMTQYDIEVKKYDEILKTIYSASLNVKNLYKVYIEEDIDSQNKKMQKLREATIASAEACSKSCEESASFIRPNVCDAMRQYVGCILELEHIHRECKYGIQNDCSPEKKVRAKSLVDEIEHKKQTIQDSIRTRLSQLETMTKVP